jgi:hypothetical protein
MIRRHVDLIAVALLVVLMAAGDVAAPLLAPLGSQTRRQVSLAMHEAVSEPRTGIRRGVLEVREEFTEVRREINEVHRQLLRDARELHREISKLPSCPLNQ